MSLQGIRNASEKIWAKVLLGVLIFSFVGWGAASWILGDGRINDALITIGNVSISQNDFEIERRRQLAQMSREMQQQLFTDRVSETFFNQQILTNMTTRIFLEQHAENIGLIASPSAIASIIKNSEEFWVDGQFSTDKFDAVLAMSGQTEASFTEILRRNILREMILISLANNAPAPNFMIDTIFNTRHASRRIEYSHVRFDSFSVRGQPTDEQLAETHARNPRMVSEFRTLSYVLVDARMNVQDSYERGLDAIRSIEDMLIAGDSMQEAARKMRGVVTTLPPITIQRKNRQGNEIRNQFATEQLVREMFQQELGGESPIIETNQGFVIFRVENIEPAHAAPIEGRRTELTNLWRQNEQMKLAYARANEIIVDRVDLATKATVTRASGAPLEVLNAAFAMDVGRKQIVPAASSFYVVRVVEEIPAAENAAQRTALRNEIETMLARQLIDDYMSFLARKYKIKQNDRMLRRLFNE